MTHRVRLTVSVLITLLIASACAPAARAAPQADSVILFVCDGFGPGHVAMARAAIGRPLALERAQFSGTAITTSLGGGVTDSAAAATALATGYKTTNGTLSLSPEGQPLKTILERCREDGKAVAVITTDALWGATPAGFLAHAASRGRKSEIALQVAQSQTDVMLGHGSGQFLPASAGGERTDGKDLVSALRDSSYEVVFTRYELLTAQKQRLVGLFDDGPQQPALRDMLMAALCRVGGDLEGFLVVIEHPGLDGDPGDPSGALADMLEIDELAAIATDWARAHGHTLVVVTGDHDSGGLQVERAERVPALLKVRGSASDLAGRANADRTNIAEVMSEFAGVTDLTPAELDEIRQAKQAKDTEKAIGAVLSARTGLKWTARGHTATPVPVYAFGPGAEAFVGTMDNTDIPKRIATVLGLEAASHESAGGTASRLLLRSCVARARAGL